MPWFVKIETGKVDQYVPAHKSYVKELITKGHKAKTGYWSQKGGGMMLFEAESMDEAQAIVGADPLVHNDCVSYQLFEWQIVVE
jgi:uncharacterized protein YciI